MPNCVRAFQDKRKIVLDDKLKTIFSGSVDIFSMNKQLSKHVWVAGEPHADRQDASITCASLCSGKLIVVSAVALHL